MHACGDLFSRIIQQLYKECSCQTIEEYFKQVFSQQIPCMDLFHCNTISEINEHEEILSKLEKAFISRR